VRVRAYVRVSTAEQNCELQSRGLHAYAERRGWQIAEVYQDVDSGAKSSRTALTRLIAVTQGLDTDPQNPASRFLLHVLGAAAEFERSLIRERTQAGQNRCREDFESGKVGKTVNSRSGRNLPPHRPRKIFDREEVFQLRRQGRSYRQIAKSLALGVGTVVRTLQERSKSS
jgi:DNA invertase Pin-like site-specific DNA recombinase